MGKDAQIRQLIEAVQHHPGSPAFALLTEHHLEQGNIDEALTVASQGFATNPGYERGAVAYLTALRRKGNTRTAGDVFGKAVAYLPRSSRLRLQWAMILAEAGRDQEARRFAREALNLDPLSRDARAMVATMGEAATPMGGTQEYCSPPVVDDREQTDDLEHLEHPEYDLEHEADQLFDETDLEQDASGLSRQAQAQRAAAIRPRIRPIGQRTTPHALFDLTPGPMIVDARQVGPRGLQRSPFDITPMPLPRQGATPSPTGDLDRAPPLAPPPTPDAKQPSPDPDAPQISPLVVPGPATDPAPVLIPGAVLRDLPRRRHRWIWIVVALVLVGGACAGGFLFYRHVQDGRIEQAVLAALSHTRPDILPGYAAARNALSRQLREHPDDARVRAALALTNAQLVARFGGDHALLSQADELLRGMTSPDPVALTARALLMLHRGKVNDAQKTLAHVTGGPWPTTLARLLCAEPGKQMALVRSTLASPQVPPALALETATRLRWSGKLERARTIVDAGLRASPTHPGLRIEQVLIDLEDTTRKTSPPLSDADLARLAQLARNVPRYLAAVELLRARVLAARGEAVGAIASASRAISHGPNTEAAVTLGRLLLGSSGDVARALPLLEQNVAVMSAFDPVAPAWLVQALLALARPHEARALLGEIPAGGDARRAWIDTLLVQCASLSDDDEGLQRLCRAPASVRARVGCVEASLQRSNLKQAEQLARPLRRHRLFATYLQGLHALAQGDTGAAVKLLSRTDIRALPDPVAARLALAMAYTRQGDSSTAIRILRQSVVHDARSVRSRLALAVALVAAGHDSEAESMLEEVLRAKPTQASILARAGQAFLSLGLSAKALTLLQHGIKFNPGSTTLELLQGRVAMANKQMAEARALFDRILVREPNNPEALVELGRIEATSKQSDRARKHFARALELRPSDPDLLLLLSRAQAQSGDYRSALTHGMKAIKLLKQTGQALPATEALVQLGHTMRQGDAWAQARAEELLFEATKSRAPPAAAYLEMGLLYQTRRDHNRTVWSFKQAVERDPSFAEAHLQLGLTLLRKPRTRRQGKKALRRYLKLRPKGPQAARVRAVLKRAR